MIKTKITPLLGRDYIKVGQHLTGTVIYGWGSFAIVQILKKREYLGHMVNFKTRKPFREQPCRVCADGGNDFSSNQSRLYLIRFPVFLTVGIPMAVVRIVF